MKVEGKPLSEFDIKPGDRFKFVGWLYFPRLPGDVTYIAQYDYLKYSNELIIVGETDKFSWFNIDDDALFIRLDDQKQYVTINQQNGKGQFHKDKDALNKYVKQSSHQFKVYELGKELEFTKEVVWK